MTGTGLSTKKDFVDRNLFYTKTPSKMERQFHLCAGNILRLSDS